MHSVYIALGSNIDPEENLKKAAMMLRGTFMNGTFSSVYKSKAAEVEDQDDFLNAVAHIKTDRSLEEVRAGLTIIENALGKDPPYRFGPRTIDLDLLLYDDLVLPFPSSPVPEFPSSLIIPHPRMHQRRFVLEPLSELDASPHWKELLKNLSNQQCERTEITL